MQTLIASIFVFGLLILVHELGHFFAARLTGIRVLELAIGFGPKLAGWEKDGTAYSLRVFPLGGFCRMLGEDPEEAAEPDSFPQKPVISRAAVLLAGSAMNLFLAILIFFILFFFITGVPGTETTTIGYVLENTPAEEAGLQDGDRIISINGSRTELWDDILVTVSARQEKELTVLIDRDGREIEFRMAPMIDPDTGRAMIGIAPTVQKFRFVSSLGASFERFGLIIGSMTQVFTGQAPLDVTGPVGIVFVIGEVAQTGFINLLLLAALISISLGIMNLLPIPALDGGRLLFLAIEGIRGKKVDPEKEGFIHFIGFAILIALILMVTYRDLMRWDIFPGN